jgi:hypothetical protein
MSAPKFIWIIRSWCSLDTFWEHVREHKEYDIAYVHPELILEEIERILAKEQSDWKDMCIGNGNGTKISDREFDIDKPSLEQIKSRPFVKFMSITSSQQSSEDYMQSWYVERLKVAEKD